MSTFKSSTSSLGSGNQSRPPTILGREGLSVDKLGISKDESLRSLSTLARRETTRKTRRSSEAGTNIPLTVEEWLIAGVYVMFYAVVTRLPMTFAVIHMHGVYGLDAAWCAAFFCAYCVGRMIAAYFVQFFFSMKTVVCSTLAGSLSFIIVFFFGEHWQVFGASCFVWGLAETVTGFDVILQRECELRKFSQKRKQKTFRFCMIVTTIGSSTAYSLGGYVYEVTVQDYGLRICCGLGLVSSIIQLVALFLYWLRRRDFITSGFRISSRSVRGTRRKSVRASYHSDSAERRRIWLSMWTIVASMYITPMAVGTNFATITHFWLVRWNVGTSVSGMFMAIGEFLGVAVLLFLQWPPVFNSRITFPFGMPVNVCVTSMVIGCCCYSVTLPNIAISAVGTCGVHAFNAAIHSFCNELCAVTAPPDEFAEWQGRAYLAKRFSNCTMGLVQTILSSISPFLPFLVTGSVMVIWGVLLVAFYIYNEFTPIQVRRALLQVLRASSEKVSETSIRKSICSVSASSQDSGLNALQVAALVHQLEKDGIDDDSDEETLPDRLIDIDNDDVPQPIESEILEISLQTETPPHAVKIIDIDVVEVESPEPSVEEREWKTDEVILRRRLSSLHAGY